MPIPDASLAIGKPVTSTIAKQLRTNPIAIAQGHSNAERIWAQSLRYKDFITSEDWPVPQGVRRAYVEVIGGGAGGQRNAGSAANVGGGAGGRAEGWVELTPGDIIPITIGQGGVGATSISLPSNGGTSSFGSYMSATGGRFWNNVAAFNSAYSATSNRNDVIDLIASFFNGGMGVGGEFNYGGSNGQIRNYNHAQGGKGVGGFGGIVEDGLSYGDGAGNGAPVTGFAGKGGIVRIWF